MTTQEAVRLIHKGVSTNAPQAWADLGSGAGTFTMALASLLPSASIVHAVDKQTQSLPSVVNETQIKFYKADFEKNDLPFSDLDGIMMANSLHYVAHPLPLIKRLSKMLKPNGNFMLVEYDRRQANQWVPYPISFDSAVKLFSSAGYNKIIKTGERPSRYGQAIIYSIVASNIHN